MTSLPILTLAAVLLLIAFRRFGPLRLAIWQIVGAGALVVLAGGSISPAAAWQAIDWEVILFLFGVFVVGQTLVQSGFLFAVSARLLGHFHSADGLLLGLTLAAGLTSALLMNDTLAVIGTPLALELARRNGLPPIPLLLALAFAVTTGSVMSPVGNPQNLLIALYGGMASPFPAFLAGLGPPTLLSLLLCCLVVRLFYRHDFRGQSLAPAPMHPVDPALARLAQLSLALLCGGILVKIAGAFWLPQWQTGLAWIALMAALPPLLFSPDRGVILLRIDWRTLLFFAALFVLMAAVWQAPQTRLWLAPLAGQQSPSLVYLLGLGLSQLFSNVPLVSLYLPLLPPAPEGSPLLLALAAGSTLAGNLLLMGAASNVIIVQRAEQEGVHLGFFEFARVGIPLTVLQSLLFLAW